MTELTQFVRGFQKALHIEIETMRGQRGSFEVPVFNGRKQDLAFSDTTTHRRYVFSYAVANEKLNVHLECTLRHEKTEYLVTVASVDTGSVQLECNENIPLEGKGHTLVIYPWFLYEKLLSGLSEILPGHPIDNALRLFARSPACELDRSPRLDHSNLNASQQRAISLCCQLNPAFIWGPPGTGKTRTLAALLAELLHQDRRILVTSTTNAAVDQALEQLAKHPEGRPFLHQHKVIRMGQHAGSHPEMTLQEVANARDQDRRARIEAIEDRLNNLHETIRKAQEVLDQLEQTLAESQLNLFSDPAPVPHILPALRSIFLGRRGPLLAQLPPDRLITIIATRLRRLQRLHKLYRLRGKALHTAQQQREQQAFAEARLVFSTLANVYLHPLMRNASFDVVIVEEASMAVLPTLFFSACMAKEQIIVVGDPKQLPPIVQSRDAFVQKALGRSIFAIAAPTPLTTHNVALLDTQYRMHPTIGDLISKLFYHGALHSATTDRTHKPLVGKAPFPGYPLVLIDTKGHTQCKYQGHHSRCNELSALSCVALVRSALNDGLLDIGVITPYVEQARLTRDLLRREKLLGESIECSTVHRFQGREKNMIILDLVDTAPLPPGKLLADQSTTSDAARLLNVSLSRARGKLLVVADCAYFLQKIPQSTLSLFLHEARQVGLVATRENIPEHLS
jgi:hypothetical protein